MAKRKRKGATAVLAPPSEPRVMPGLIGPRRTVPASIRRPPYALSGEPGPSTSDVVRTPDEIEAMRRAGAAAAEVLMIAGSMVAPGVTTDAIDARVHEEAINRNAYPSPLNYRGFPKSVCTSINEVICHGIPDSRQLREGDIINIDVTLYLDTSGEPLFKRGWRTAAGEAPLRENLADYRLSRIGDGFLTVGGLKRTIDGALGSMSLAFDTTNAQTDGFDDPANVCSSAANDTQIWKDVWYQYNMPEDIEGDPIFLTISVILQGPIFLSK